MRRSASASRTLPFGTLTYKVGSPMSSQESESVSPQQKIFDRLEAQIPALGLQRLVGLQNMKAVLDSALKRTSDSHAVQQEQYKATLEGRQPDFANADETDDMPGDINVSGDRIENHYHQPQPAEAGKEAPSLARTLLPLALAAGTGFGGMWLYQNWKDFSWPGVADTEYEVRFFNSDGELIQIPRHGE